MKKSENKFQVVGEVSEINLKEDVRGSYTLMNFSNNSKKTITDCRVITKAEFRNPSVLIKCVTAEGKETFVGVHFDDVAEKKLNDDGVVVDNPDFKAKKTILETYKVGTRVSVDYALLFPNEYPDRDTYEFKVYNANIKAYNITSTGVPEDDKYEGDVTGVISKISREVYNDNETGRLLVEMYIARSLEFVFPVNFVVESDLADEFEDAYKKGDNASISYELITKTVGGAPKQKEGRAGRRRSNVTSGYTISEYSIFDFGEEPIDEENQYFITKKEIKDLLNKREVYKEAQIAKRKESKNKSTNMFEQSAPTKTSSKPVEEPKDPFGDDEDDDIF